MVAVPASAATVTIASESFDGGSMPAGWTSNGWNYGTSGDMVGTGGYAHTEIGYLLGLGASGVSLTSPTYDLHGYDNAYLKFNSMEQHASLLLGGAYLFVDMKVDNGPWQTIWGGANYNPRTIVVQLPSSAVGHNVKFRYFYQSTGLLCLLLSGVCQVDDVSVYTTNTSGQVQFDPATYTVDETGTNVVLTLTRTMGSAGAASVDYATSDGTAHAGTSYVASSGTVTFAAGQSTATITITIPLKDDGPDNGAKTFNVALSHPTSGLFLGTPTTATVTVNDVSGTRRPGVLQFSQETYNTYYTSPSVTLTVNRVDGSAGTVDVTCHFIDSTAKNGVSYSMADTVLTFGPGETSKTLTVPIINDGAGNTEFWVWFMNSTSTSTIGYPVTTVVTVLDDKNQKGDFQFSTTDYTVDETKMSLDVVVTRTAGSPATSVDYATSDGTAKDGTNYGAVSGTLNFVAGQTSATISVPIKDDGPSNGDKAFTMSLTNAVGGTIGTPTSTITVKDVPTSDRGLFQFNSTDYSAYETNSSLSINVERFGGSKGAATVELKYIDVTAKNGVNYDATNATLSFADGEASKTVVIPIKDDGPHNGDKQFWVWLMNPTGGTSLVYPVTAIVTVQDLYRPYTINLVPGWNLISFPVVTTVKASEWTGTGVQTVSSYNMTTGDYDSYLMNISPSSYDVTMRTDVGYFVYSDGYTSITIYGLNPSSRSATLTHGWNLIVWSSFTSSTAKVVCTEPSLAGNQTVSRYNINTGDYDSYLEGISPDSYDFVMHDGVDYFVYTDSTVSQTLYFEVI